MKRLDWFFALLLFGLLIVALIIPTMPPSASAQSTASDWAALTAPNNAHESDYDLQHTLGESVGPYAANPALPVQGESHPYSLAGQVNTTPTDGLQINNYPYWSEQSHNAHYNPSATNVPHQQPTGQRGGLPVTTTRLITNLNQFGNSTIPSGSHPEGFGAGITLPYFGVRNLFHGGLPQVGGALPPTSTGSVDLDIGAY